MAKMLINGSSAIATALLLASCVASLPLQLQGGMNLMEEEYGPSQQELLRYLEDRGFSEGRSLADSGHPTFRQMRHGLDTSFSGLGEPNRRLLSARRGGLLNRVANSDEAERFAKRNIDEIDRNAFDSFFKRNLDEIDRVGWSGFVKRLEDRQRYR